MSCHLEIVSSVLSKTISTALRDRPFAMCPGNHLRKILGWKSFGRWKVGRKLEFASHNSARLTYGLTAILDYLQRARCIVGMFGLPLKNPERPQADKQRLNSDGMTVWMQMWFQSVVNNIWKYFKTFNLQLEKNKENAWNQKWVFVEKHKNERKKCNWNVAISVTMASSLVEFRVYNIYSWH